MLTGRGISSGVYDNSYVECTSACPLSTTQNHTINNNHIAGAFYVDTYFAYALNLGNTANQIFFKVNNLFNEDPEPVGLPVSDSSNVEPGINRSLYDYLGRTFRVGFRFEWGAGA
jgi:outer membrane receptor protein involved in Fe transport